MESNIKDYDSKDQIVETINYADRAASSYVVSQPAYSEKVAAIIEDNSFRELLVNSCLVIWTFLLIPYDCKAYSFESYGDASLFLASLYLWGIAHFLALFASIISLSCIIYKKHSLRKKQQNARKNSDDDNDGNLMHEQQHMMEYSSFAQEFKETQFYINMRYASLILMAISPSFQIVGSILFAYSYCMDYDSDEYAYCVCKQLGFYLILPPAIMAYSFFVQYFERFPTMFFGFKFNKQFRILFLSNFFFFGMLLILVNDFENYSSASANYQGFYIGYTFIWFACAMSIVLQLICHIKACKFNNYGSGHALETVFKGFIYFSLLAGATLSVFYSIESKIKESQNSYDSARISGNLIVIVFLAFLIGFETYLDNDDYNENNDNYEIIYNQDHDDDEHNDNDAVL